ncbi:MAG: hypothetical protein AAFP85_07385 [Pseudomonadota bacterium]
MLKSVLCLSFAAIFFVPVHVAADEIRLTSHDNTVRITGDFVGFRQDVYVIEFRGHLIELPIAGMNCEGKDCIAFTANQTNLARLEND